jgi:hypothetical protein
MWVAYWHGENPQGFIISHVAWEQLNYTLKEAPWMFIIFFFCKY